MTQPFFFRQWDFVIFKNPILGEKIINDLMVNLNRPLEKLRLARTMGHWVCLWLIIWVTLVDMGGSAHCRSTLFLFPGIVSWHEPYEKEEAGWQVFIVICFLLVNALWLAASSSCCFGFPAMMDYNFKLWTRINLSFLSYCFTGVFYYGSGNVVKTNT